MNKNKLEQYYPGDESWNQFTSYYRDLPSTNNLLELKKMLNNDEVLAKTIDGLVGQTATSWIMRSIPALDDLRPIDCLNSINLLNRLRTMLMRM